MQTRFLDVITAAFITVLLCANIIGTAKVVTVFGLNFGAGVFFFPISYIFGDVLTEVYGYARSRRVVWMGFSAMLFASLVAMAIVAMPSADAEQGRVAAQVFGQTPRIFIASLLAFFLGDLLNSYVLAKMKVATNGKYLWMRTIGSTIIGEAIDSLVFYPLAFAGVWPQDILGSVMLDNYLTKLAIEVLMTPVTYWVVAKLKTLEHVDYFDRDTNFSPFKF
jgi:queuosine precursor transporter